MNAFVIPLGDRLILVDTGAGELLGPKLSKVPQSLKNVGYSPEQITDILVTLIHPDHTGGLTVGGRKVFPNAVVHVDKRELAYWTDQSAGEKAPEPTKGFFKTVAPTVGPYIASGSVQTFDGETRLFPGLRSIPGNNRVSPSKVCTLPEAIYGPTVGATVLKNPLVGSGAFSPADWSVQYANSLLSTCTTAFGNTFLPPTVNPPVWSG